MNESVDGIHRYSAQGESFLCKLRKILISSCQIGSRSRFHCSAEEYPSVQRTLHQLAAALEQSRITQQAIELPSTPAASVSGTTAQSSAWSEASVTQSGTESSDGEESFQSSRESIDGSDADDREEDTFALPHGPRYLRRSWRDEPSGKQLSRPKSRQRKETSHHREPSIPIPLYIEPTSNTIPHHPQLTPPSENDYPIPSCSTPPPYAQSPSIPPNLASSIEAIQVSLTALHERMSALEHAQRMSLAAQGENPWVALAKGMGLFRLGKGSDERSRGWVVRLVMR